MQPYEALNVWRDLKGEDFDIQQLITALRDHAHHDLADKAVGILQSRLQRSSHRNMRFDYHTSYAYALNVYDLCESDQVMSVNMSNK